MSPLLDLRYRLEYLVLRLIIGFVRLFPLDAAADISARAWRAIAPRTRRHAKALANLAVAFPDMSLADREKIALEMWDNIGRVMAETMQIDRLMAEPARMEVEDDFFVRRYRGRVGAVVAVSMHMGNWELSSWPLVLCDTKIAIVYRIVKNPYVDRYLRSMRGYLYDAGLYAKGKAHGMSSGHDTARIVMSQLRQSGRLDTSALAMLADLYDGKGVAVPFFGREAKSTPFPALVARRTGARIWVGRCIRVGRATRFKVSVQEIKVPRTSDAEADVHFVTAAIQKQFEEWIRETPGQFMWINRRFA